MTTTETTTKRRASYTLASPRANHPLTVASELVSILSHSDKRLATLLATRVVSIEHDVITEGDVTALTRIANSDDVRKYDGSGVRDAILALRDLALTILGAHAFANKVLPIWADTHEEIVSVTFGRTSTAKSARYEVIATVKGETRNFKVHMTVNSTAALDLRKIEKSYIQKRENAAKRAARKDAAAAKRAARKRDTAAKRAARKTERENKLAAKATIREFMDNATPEQLAKVMELMAA